MSAGGARAIFVELVGQVPPEQWEARLDELAGGDHGLRDRVAALLAAHRQADSFLERPAAPVGGTVDQAPGAPVDAGAAEGAAAEGPGAVLGGRYKLVEEIGEGGMGTVWMAQQQEPVKRLVALKLIKAGMDSNQVLARFEAERQALAVMDHPNIAKVLDAGATLSGRPYFVMELVKGAPLTKYCDEQRLTPRERLELFVPVCQAIQHAHQKGVIHRDVKPSNVLIALYDGKPVPKVIDFGIAKATGQPLTEHTLVTGSGAVVGTLEYMSPEQAELNQLDVDTRSDVYSLGVLLYELLTGTTPLEKKRLKEAALLEVLRLIREEEPPRPSTRLSSTDELPAVAANRGLEPKKLSGVVRGELDWIVMKCLEKDRNRRYETANGLARDVERYLADEPVLACPPSAWYRARKFTRRNRAALAVAGGALLFLALLVGGGGWVVRDRAAREQEIARDRLARRQRLTDQVEMILAEVERLQHEQKWPEAQAALERAEAALGGGEGEGALRERLSAERRDLAFVARLDRVQQDAAFTSEGNRDFRRTDEEYARVFREYGVDVERLPAQAVIAALAERPALAVPVASALDWWGFAQRGLGESEQRCRALVALARGIDPSQQRNRLRARWDSRITPETQADLRQLARSFDVRSQAPATIRTLSFTLDQWRLTDLATQVLRDGQSAHPNDFWLNFTLGFRLLNQKDSAGAVRFTTAAVSLRPGSVAAHINLGLALKEQGKLAEAIDCYQKAIALNPNATLAHLNLGTALVAQKKYGRAIACFRKAIATSPNFAPARLELGNALSAQKKVDQAIASFRKAIELAPKYAEAHNRLGVALDRQGKLEEAIACWKKAIKLDPSYAPAHNNLAKVLNDKGQVDEAIAYLKKAIALGPNDAMPHYNLGIARKSQGDLDGAEACYRRALALDPKFTAAHIELGIALDLQGKSEEAIAWHQKALALDKSSVLAHVNLGVALAGTGKVDEAIAWYRKAIALDPKNAIAHYNLGNTLQKQGKLAEAIVSFRQAIAIDGKLARAHNGLGKCLARQKKLAEAVPCFEQAVALDPNYALAYRNLGNALLRQNQLDRADAAYRKALSLNPGISGTHNEFGLSLARRNRLAEAVSCYQKALRIDPMDAIAHTNLGNALARQNKLAEAVAYYQQAIKIDPNYAWAHYNLGKALYWQKKVDEAIPCYRRAIDLDPKDATAHTGLGNALHAQKKVDEAIPCYQMALLLNPNDAGAFNGLGLALAGQNKLERAIACYRQAIKIDPKYAAAHYYLGNALKAKGQLEGAAAAYREAIQANKNLAEAHCNLGGVLRRQGQLRQALAALRRGHELGLKTPGWRYPSAQWVRDCERLVDLEKRLLGLPPGAPAPASPAELMELVGVYRSKRLYRAAARFAEEAVARAPKRANDLVAAYRYNAACVAALAAAGQGQDTAGLDEKEKARLRGQALGWLQADLALWASRLAGGKPADRAAVEVALRHWQADADFAGVRDRAALARLPEPERQPWQQLWGDVADTLARAQRQATPTKQPDKK
jgi:tetratricopeptide (TPR) repeat protein